MPYGLDDVGRPTFLVSALAMHTKNLVADPRASLLVTERLPTNDPIAGARATLVGNVTRIEAPTEVRDDYLARHAEARAWIDLGDFAFYRMDVVAVYWIAGFGAMGWIEADDYRRAAIDPLADAEDAIVAHMNADHADALIAYSRHYAGLPAESAALVGVDRLGFRMSVRVADRTEALRLSFPNEVRTSEEARKAFIGMLRIARPAER